VKEIKYSVLICVLVRTFLIPFYYGVGTIINSGSGSTRQKVTVPTFSVPVPQQSIVLGSDTVASEGRG
jgi:hypothetical protein